MKQESIQNIVNYSNWTKSNLYNSGDIVIIYLFNSLLLPQISILFYI